MKTTPCKIKPVGNGRRLRKIFWNKVARIWLEGDFKKAVEMILTVTKHEHTKRDILAVKKFILPEIR